MPGVTAAQGRASVTGGRMPGVTAAFRTDPLVLGEAAPVHPLETGAEAVLQVAQVGVDGGEIGHGGAGSGGRDMIAARAGRYNRAQQ
jgi:hypothetical protein